MTTNYREMAVEFANKQASIKPMSSMEFANCVRETEAALRALDEPEVTETPAAAPEFACDPKRAIKENSVTCVVCGKSFKVITKAHLLLHGMTPEQYRTFCGYAKGTPLIAKSLQRERRNKMQDMKLWEKRRIADTETEQPDPAPKPKAKSVPAPTPVKKEKSADSVSENKG